MSESHRITDLKKIWVSYGPFKLITFNSIDLEFYRDEQNKLSARFKYDIHFGDYIEGSSKQLFVGIDVRDVPYELRDDKISHEYQTSSFISDVKNEEFHIVNDTTSRISLPTHSMNVVYWSFECDLKDLDNVRATSDPVTTVDIPIYLHSAKAQGYGMVNHLNNINKREPCFIIRVDLEKNRSMIAYVPDTDLSISFDKLTEEDKDIELEFIMKDLPKFTLPIYAKEVTREVMLQYAKDQDDRTLAIEKEIRNCLLSWSSTSSDGQLGEGRMVIQDVAQKSDGGYTYTPMATKWFLNY